MLHFTLTLPSAFLRDFKRKARRYWDVQGSVVGDLLSFHRPQNLVQLREAYRRRYGRDPHSDPTLDHYLAHALLRLAEHGFVHIDPAVRQALDTPTPLAFRLVTPRPVTTADKAWPACGRLTGRVLSPLKPMTLDQVVAAIRRVAAEGQDSPPTINPMLAAHCLLELAEAGVVEVLQTAAWE